MNVNNYGTVINVLTSFDMSSNTSVSLEFQTPSGSSFTRAGQIVNTTVTAPDGTSFPANEYVQYTVANGDINVAGAWKVRAIYEDSTQYLTSDWVSFMVGK